jgi:outer membrane protein assembly factor BamB
MAVGGEVLCIGGLVRPGVRRSMPSRVHALRASDGIKKWSYRGIIINNLTATSDGVYFADDGVTPYAPAQLTALRSSDGKRLWRLPLAQFGPRIGGGPTVAESVVYAGANNLQALRASDGAQIWKSPADVTSNPVVCLGIVYVLGTKESNGTGLPLLHAFRAADGSQLWNSLGPYEGGSLTTDGNIICGLHHSGPSTRLWAWRASDGTTMWKSDANDGFASAVIAGGVIYAVSATSELLALRASDGAKIWGCPANVHTAPTINKGVIYVGASGGGLLALSASNGKQIWRSPVYFTAGPVVGADTVFISDGAKVYAFST